MGLSTEKVDDVVGVFFLLDEDVLDQPACRHVGAAEPPDDLPVGRDDDAVGALQLPDGGPVKRRLAELVCWRFTTSGALSPTETGAPRTVAVTATLLRGSPLRARAGPANGRVLRHQRNGR